ncbi:MAG TPA: CHAT domain-containing protein [Chloroflexia bacterium]|nr:CHAT domain-containing protein [Chloroflexia bacterium]
MSVAARAPQAGEVAGLGMELLIGATPAGDLAASTPVQAVLGTGERAHGTLSFAGQVPELNRLVARVQSRQAADPEVVRLGSLLFNALFQDAIGAAYREARGRARATGTAVRIVLTSASAAVAGLPWEFVYDPSLRHFLALTPDVRLTRSLPTLRPLHPPPGRLPVRVLLGVAGPTTYAGQRLFGLDVAAERALMDAALAPLVQAGSLEVHTVNLAQPNDLLAAVRRTAPHIFHYIGHGGVDHGQPLLLCGPAGGASVPLTAAQLAATLSLAPELQVVLLNCCWGGQASVQGDLFGLAPALSEAGIPAVIGWQTAISDQSAPWLAARLYEELARGATIDEALTVARLALYANSRVERLAWGLAVGYLRRDSTRIVALPVKPCRLLMIDDEQERADLLQSHLARRGLEITWAPGGVAGLEQARRLHPDVIVLDLKMPEMDGFEVLRRLKAGPTTADIPVVVLTSLGLDYEVGLRAYSGGAMYVIPYNGRLDQLAQVLRRNLHLPID